MKIKEGKFWRGEKILKAQNCKSLMYHNSQCKLRTQNGVRLTDALGSSTAKDGRSCRPREEDRAALEADRHKPFHSSQ